MTTREQWFAAVTLVIGIIGGNLWLQLRDARNEISELQATQLSDPARVSALPITAPNTQNDPIEPTGPVDQTERDTRAALPPLSELERPPPQSQVRTLGNRGIPGAESVMESNDLNGDGVITEDEAKRADRFLAMSWDRYDLNKDGLVVAEEFNEVQAEEMLTIDNGARRGGTLSGGAPPNSVLSSNDLNGDGVITRAEARSANRNLNRQWDTYDVNKDGIVDLQELTGTLGRGGR